MRTAKITIRQAARNVAFALGMLDLHDRLRAGRGPLTREEQDELRADLHKVKCGHVKGSLGAHLDALYLALPLERPTTAGERPRLRTPGTSPAVVAMDPHAPRMRTRGRPSKQLTAKTLSYIETIVRARSIDGRVPRVVVFLLVVCGFGAALFPVEKSTRSFVEYATRRLEKLTRERRKQPSQRPPTPPRTKTRSP